jgi:hypothetical protein
LKIRFSFSINLDIGFCLGFGSGCFLLREQGYKGLSFSFSLKGFER